MSPAWLCILVVILSSLNLHNAAAQSQMCEEPFQAVLTLVNNVTFPRSTSFLDSDLVYYREILHFSEEEINRERELGMRFFNDTYGLDFSNIEPNEQGQRILENSTFEPFMFSFNNTYVYNSWLVKGKTKTRCFQVGDGGFRVRFTGTVMLHGEYGGKEGKLVFAMQRLVYGHDYLYDACKQQGIIFQLESLTPLRGVPIDSYIVRTFRVRNRMLGEGTAWGVSRISVVNPTTLRYELRQVYSFL